MNFKFSTGLKCLSVFSGATALAAEDINLGVGRSPEPDVETFVKFKSVSPAAPLKEKIRKVNSRERLKA